MNTGLNRMKEKKAHRIKQDKETLSITKNIEFRIF